MMRISTVEAAAIGGFAVAAWVSIGPLGVVMALAVGLASFLFSAPYAFVVGQVLLVALVPTTATGFLGAEVALLGLVVGDLEDAGEARRTVPIALGFALVGLSVVFVAVPYGTMAAAVAVVTAGGLALGVLSQYTVVGGT